MDRKYYCILKIELFFNNYEYTLIGLGIVSKFKLSMKLEQALKKCKGRLKLFFRRKTPEDKTLPEEFIIQVEIWTHTAV